MPQKALVLEQQNLANCNDQTSTLNASINKSTENSETFSKTDTISSSTTIAAGYSNPLGGSVEASETVEVSGSNAHEKTHSETVTWETGINVPVGPGRAVQLQFVVAQSVLDVPWSTNVIVSGPAEITYTKPADARLCMYNDKNNRSRSKCIRSATAVNWPNLKDVKWDSHNKNMNDQISAISLEGAAQVIFYKHKNRWRQELDLSRHDRPGRRRPERRIFIDEIHAGPHDRQENLRG